MYVSVDPGHPALKTLNSLRRAERSKFLQKLAVDNKSNKLLQDFVDGKRSWRSAANSLSTLHVDLLDDGRFLGDNTGGDSQSSRVVDDKDEAFDCALQFETQLPTGDKTDEKYDALSPHEIELLKDWIDQGLPWGGTSDNL